MGERLGAVFLGSCGCCLHIRPQVRIVLDVEATAVEGVRTVRGSHDRVGSGDGGRPRITSNLFVRYHPFDLDDRPVCRPVQEQVEPPWSAQVLRVAVCVGRSGVQPRQGRNGSD